MNYVLSVKNLNKTYRNPDFIAVNNISFDIKQGEILGILGPNGAGKTTTIQMILGTLTPTSGAITAFGLDYFKHKTKILQHMSFASTYVELSSNITVYENLKIHGYLYGVSSKNINNIIEKNLKQFDVWRLKDRRSNMLSAGQKTRVMLAQAFLCDPKLVLLDEPTASLDPDIAGQVRDFIIEQQQEKQTSILITSHNMTEVEEVCDRVLVMKNGNIIANDTPDNLAASILTSKIQLNVGDGLKRTIAIVLHKNMKYEIKHRWIEIEVHDNKIAELLSDMAKSGVSYTDIYINKPTLEDYFINLSK